jgi:predicted DNA-binding transcriptional regulator AlpA
MNSLVVVDPEGSNLLDLRALRIRVGGSRPVHGSTVYRLIARGLLPKPLHIGASSRWLRQEVEAALARMMEARR